MPKQERPGDIMCGRCYRYVLKDEVKPHDVYNHVCKLCYHALKEVNLQ